MLLFRKSASQDQVLGQVQYSHNQLPPGLVCCEQSALHKYATRFYFLANRMYDKRCRAVNFPLLSHKCYINALLFVLGGRGRKAGGGRGRGGGWGGDGVSFESNDARQQCQAGAYALFHKYKLTYSSVYLLRLLQRGQQLHLILDVSNGHHLSKGLVLPFSAAASGQREGEPTVDWHHHVQRKGAHQSCKILLGREEPAEKNMKHYTVEEFQTGKLTV